MNTKYKLEVKMNEADYQAIVAIAGKRRLSIAETIYDAPVKSRLQEIKAQNTVDVTDLAPTYIAQWVLDLDFLPGSLF